MKRLTVSVAIALYNGEKFIEKQLDTIRLQTVKPDQVVMCDDCSKDNTFKVVEEYINRHSLQDSWKIYKNEQNLGYAKNFYHAMELCDSDLIYMCDQDDIWKPDKIEKMNMVMENNSHISLLMCKGGVIDADGDDLHGLMIKKAKETGSITQVSVEEILRVFDWTGMLMCVRNRFFAERKDIISNIKAPHDFVLALSSADCGSFYVYDYIKPEYKYGNSRVDFYMEKNGKKYLMEVKGCTLEIDGIGYFPDAPTERGVKHLRELAEAAKQGYHCSIAFVIQMPGITKVLPNEKTHPEFKIAFDEAVEAGVEVLYLQCEVREDELEIKK